MKNASVLHVLMALLLLLNSSAYAAVWSRQYIARLPDSAFAAIERSPDGKTLRHLPHHNASGEVDIPHLCNALSRANQVKWHDPAAAKEATRHLSEHLKAAGGQSCRPKPSTAIK